MLVIIIITIILDYLLSYFIPSYFNNLTLFYPMLTLTLVIFLHDKTKNYFKTIFIIGFIYDLLFSYIFLFNSLIFLLFGKLVKKIDKLIRTNYLVNILLVIVCIFLYDLILFMLVKLSNYNVVTLSDLIYKFKNSIIVNILYFSLLSIIKIPNKKKNKYIVKGGVRNLSN